MSNIPSLSHSLKRLLHFILLLFLHSSFASANTLTFLFENEYNETTTMAQCRNSIDKVLINQKSTSDQFRFSGKSLNNMGDLESCQRVAMGEYLLIEISGDVYNETLFSRGGKGYFYQRMTSLIGICVPKLCTLDEMEFLKRYFYK